MDNDPHDQPKSFLDWLASKEDDCGPFMLTAGFIRFGAMLAALGAFALLVGALGPGGAIVLLIVVGGALAVFHSCKHFFTYRAELRTKRIQAKFDRLDELEVEIRRLKERTNETDEGTNQ